MRHVVWAWSAAAAVGLAGVVVVAADPPPPAHFLVGEPIDADDVRRVGEFLLASDGSAPKGSLLDEALDLFRKKKATSARELAEELARRHQELLNPDQFDALVDQFENLQKRAAPLVGLVPKPLVDPIDPTKPITPGTGRAREGTGLAPGVGDPIKPGTTPGNAKPPPLPAGKDPNPPKVEGKPKSPTKDVTGPSDKKPADPKAGPGAKAADAKGTAPPKQGGSPQKQGGSNQKAGGTPPKDGKQGGPPGNTTNRNTPPPRRPFDPELADQPTPRDGSSSDTDSWTAMQQRAKAEADTRDKRQRQFDAVRGFWENSFGDLNNTPAVRDMLRDMFAGPNPIAPGAAEGLLALLGDQSASTRGFAQWASDQGDLFDDIKLSPFGRRFGGFHLPAFDATANVGGGALSYQPGGAAGEGSWLSVVLFVVVAGGALVAWRFWPRPGEAVAGPRPIPGLGPWPIDPRVVADRADLIRAFEYLSVLMCGTRAKACHHLAIADALRAAAGSGDAAEPLARGYALARYTPAADPLPPGTIAEARGHLCRLAGVAAP